MSALFSSPGFLAANVNLVEVFANTDPVGQVITGLLGVFSLFAWSVMLGKWFELKKLRQLNLAYEQRLKSSRQVLDVAEELRGRRAIPYGDLYADALEAYWRAAAIGKEKGDDQMRSRLEHAENALQRALARQSLRYESNMIILASLVSGAPFMGLFGTVWGIMEAFGAIAEQGSATLTTLAPGVSAALLTTIAGLVVAIPSVFGYNFLLGNVKTMITELENYASTIADRIELEAK